MLWMIPVATALLGAIQGANQAKKKNENIADNAHLQKAIAQYGWANGMSPSTNIAQTEDVGTSALGTGMQAGLAGMNIAQGIDQSGEDSALKKAMLNYYTSNSKGTPISDRAPMGPGTKAEQEAFLNSDPSKANMQGVGGGFGSVSNPQPNMIQSTQGNSPNFDIYGGTYPMSNEALWLMMQKRAGLRGQ
jgi:hypothetical protein